MAESASSSGLVKGNGVSALLDAGILADHDELVDSFWTMAIKWRWSYNSPLGDNEDGVIRARGTLLTSNKRLKNGFYKIKSIKGKRDGDLITGLVDAGTPIPGNTIYAGDNLIRSNRKGRPQLTGNGFQYALDNGTYSNVFYADFLAPPSYLEFHSVPPFPEGPTLPNTELGVVFRAVIL
jgi:subtilisin family serine protease